MLDGIESVAIDIEFFGPPDGIRNGPRSCLVIVELKGGKIVREGTAGAPIVIVPEILTPTIGKGVKTLPRAVEVVGKPIGMRCPVSLPVPRCTTAEEDLSTAISLLS